jgi:hypothetical protein
MILILIAIPAIVHQSFSTMQHASVTVDPSVRALEKKLEGIDASGHMDEHQAAILKILEPKIYAALAQSGVIAQTTVNALTSITPPSTNTSNLPTTFAQTTQAFGTGSVSLQLSVPPPPSLPIFISSCGAIASGGSYVVTQNLSSQNTTCLNIHDASNVTLDCGGHSIATGYIFGSGANAAIVFNNVKGFTLKNCTASSVSQMTSSVGVLNSSNGIIQNNSFATNNSLNWGFYGVSLSSSSATTVNKNTVTGGSIFLVGSSSNVITSNTVVNPLTSLNIFSLVGENGSQNTFSNNTVDGGFVPGSTTGVTNGVDDGIVIADESSDTITGNTLSRFFDCGIETFGYIQNTSITKNTINNSIYGIGEWYNGSWLNNTVSDNVLNNSSGEIFMLYDFFQAPPQQAVYFQNNTFTGNRITNPVLTPNTPTWQHSFSTYVYYIPQYYDNATHQYYPFPSNIPLITSNNVFTNNNFNIDYTNPYFSPVAMVIDGGGNICSSIGGYVNNEYALQCTIPTWRIISGTINSTYVDSLGHPWGLDQNYQGGSYTSTQSNITGTVDPTLYQSERLGNSFGYSFNVPTGNYQVTLKFAEIDFTSSNKRKFNVSINGIQVLTNFDIVADVGSSFKADDKVFNNIASNAQGKISIQFAQGTLNVPKISAIQIIPQPLLPTSTPTVQPSISPTCIPPVCAAPPKNCYYSGGNTCSCGQLVCITSTPTPTP